MFIKLRKYAFAGVREYWIVDPKNKKVIKYLFLPPEKDAPEGNTEISIYGFEDQVPIAIFDNKCSIDFKAIYDYYSFIEGS